jgi:small subunit ribosomal protein S2
MPDVPFADLKEFHEYRKKTKRVSRSGTNLVQAYNPFSLLKSPPSPDEITLPMLLANQTHLGHHTSLWNPANSSYIFGVREGIHIISLDVTYAYLKRAAKVVHEVARRGGLILFVGTRKGQTETVVASAKRAGGYHLFDRWVPGTLTNGQQLLEKSALKAVNIRDEELTEYSELLSQGAGTTMRPDLVICLNPLENEICLYECGIFTIPTIGVIDTDANPSWVTYPIPANDDSQRSIALIAGVLGRAAEEGQRLRREAASAGAAMYDTRPARAYLKAVDVISSMEVAASKEGKKDKDAD